MVRPTQTSGDGSPRCAQQVEAATRKSELRVVEDQVDAVVCAYVGVVSPTGAPTGDHGYGDAETGVIVTPTLPPELQPAPVAAPVAGPGARGRPGLRRAASPSLVAAAASAVALRHRDCSTTPASTTCRSTGRTKSVASFAEKATRTVDGRAALRRPAARTSPTSSASG